MAQVPIDTLLEDTFPDFGGERDSQPRMALAKDTRFADRFVLEERVGVGAMGDVYRAFDERLQEEVAVKIVTGGLTPDGVSRFHREINLARKVTHPNVVRTHDVGEHDGQLFLTMEFIKGGTLDDELDRDGKLEPSAAVDIALDIAAGMRAAHGAKVIHRDLKPGNVLLGTDGRVVITDFGIAQALLPDEVAGVENAGTPMYMAPEQVLNLPVDERADVFSFGVMLYEMLTGEFPYPDVDAIAMLIARTRQPAQSIFEQDETLPEELGALVMDCLQRLPVQRPKNFGDVGRRLEAWRNGTIGRGVRRPARPTTKAILNVPSVAVVPFRYRGDDAQAFVAPSLTKELSHSLMRTASLRVLVPDEEAANDAASAVRLAASLDVDYLVTGSVVQHEDELKVTARLLDVGAGTQVWSSTLASDQGGLLDLELALARRIAETLRVELDVAGHKDISPNALESYLRARQDVQNYEVANLTDVANLLSQCLKLAPAFAPAHALAAFVAVKRQRRVRSGAAETAANFGDYVTNAIEGARRCAPDHPETHLAQGVYHLDLGDAAEAGRAFQRAIAIAPNFSFAHRQIAELEIDADLIPQATTRLQLAQRLNPNLKACHRGAARIALVRGDRHEFDTALAALSVAGSGITGVVTYLNVRAALWFNDDRYVTAARSTSEIGNLVVQHWAKPVLAAITGKLSALEAEELLSPFLKGSRPGPLRAHHQTFADIHASQGNTAAAVESVRAAVACGLTDLAWCRHSPPLQKIASSSEFQAARRIVERRIRTVHKLEHELKRLALQRFVPPAELSLL